MYFTIALNLFSSVEEEYYVISTGYARFCRCEFIRT